MFDALCRSAINVQLVGDMPSVVPGDRDKELKEGGAQKLIWIGAGLAGGAAAGALGFLAAGPAGAAALGALGVAAANVLEAAGEEASKRLLAPREAVRVGSVLAIAAADVRKRIEQGERIRDDSFFQKRNNGRSEAEEVTEAVLLKCQREPEERKIQYMANLISGIAFDDQISAGLAHQLIKIAENLTYRQLCIIKLSAIKSLLPLRRGNYRNAGGIFAPGLVEIFYECHDLYTRGLINYDGDAALGILEINPSKMNFQGLGAQLFNLMKLGELPMSDVEPIAEALST